MLDIMMTLFFEILDISLFLLSYSNSWYNYVMNQHIIFFGSGGYTIPIVKQLRNRGLELVITTEKNPSTFQKAQQENSGDTTPLVEFLKKENIPFLTSHLKNKEDIERIEDIKPTLGVLASYGAIIPNSIINLFQRGILNIHPSLLPKYKGPSPIQSTLLNGEVETGVTIIKLDNEVDHGPVVSQEKIQLKGTETTEDLKYSLFKKGGDLINTILDELEKGDPLITYAQDHAQEVFTKKIEKKDGLISLENIPHPKVLDERIRAYHPWPGVYFKCQMSNVKFPISNDNKKPSTLEGKIIKLLPGERIQVEGKKVMSYKDFKNGYPEGKEILKKLGFN